jgi:hypothetical protein
MIPGTGSSFRFRCFALVVSDFCRCMVFRLSGGSLMASFLSEIRNVAGTLRIGVAGILRIGTLLSE